MTVRTILITLAIPSALALGAAAGAYWMRGRAPDAFASKRYVWEGWKLEKDTTIRLGGNRLPANVYTDGTTVQTGYVFPTELDNRALCAPIYDQGETNYCAYFTLSAYVSAKVWQRTGNLMRVDPYAIGNRLMSMIKIRHGEKWVEEFNVKHTRPCRGCLYDLVGDLIGLPTNKLIRARSRKQINAMNTAIREATGGQLAPSICDAVKREIHREGILLAQIVVPQIWFHDRVKDGTIYKMFPIGEYGVADEMHLIILCGWTRDGFIFANTWGGEWGAKGFGVVPFDQFERILFYIYPTTEKRGSKNE